MYVQGGPTDPDVALPLPTMSWSHTASCLSAILVCQGSITHEDLSSDLTGMTLEHSHGVVQGLRNPCSSNTVPKLTLQNIEAFGYSFPLQPGTELTVVCFGFGVGFFFFFSNHVFPPFLGKFVGYFQPEQNSQGSFAEWASSTSQLSKQPFQHHKKT